MPLTLVCTQGKTMSCEVEGVAKELQVSAVQMQSFQVRRMGPVKACKGESHTFSNLLSCFGGQQARAAKRIGQVLDSIPHDKYVEPFLGSGAVWRAKGPSPKEILNDKSCKRVNFAKRKTCSTTDLTKCERLSVAKISCGQDYKRISKAHDSRGTLHYLDPPYVSSSGKVNKALTYDKKDVPFEEFVEFARSLKGKVAISYRNKPEFAKALCRKPFRCTRITKDVMGREYTELLAVKR